MQFYMRQKSQLEVNRLLVTIERLSSNTHLAWRIPVRPQRWQKLLAWEWVFLVLVRPGPRRQTQQQLQLMPLYSTTHTGFNEHWESTVMPQCFMCKVATDWFLEKNDELVCRSQFHPGYLYHRISNPAVRNHQALTPVIGETHWIWALLFTNGSNRRPTGGIIFFFLFPAALGPEKSFSRAARAALALATFLLGPAPRNFCPSTSTCQREHGMRRVEQEITSYISHQWLKCEMMCMIRCFLFRGRSKLDFADMVTMFSKKGNKEIVVLILVKSIY